MRVEPPRNPQEKPMKLTRTIALAGLAAATLAHADLEPQQGTGKSGGWAPRVAIKPDPARIVVPRDYKVGVFAAGLDTPSAAAVDGDGNVWVTISGPLFMQGTEPAHVKVFDKAGKLVKEIGKGAFATVMNEIGYCPENKKIYIPEHGEKIWEVDGINGDLKLVVKDLFIGDHRNGGITCKDGYLYFALGLPSNTGFADPDNHAWVDVPRDPFWVAHPDGFPPTPHDPVCRDIVHTGLNIRSSDGRLTGALLPAGVPAKKGQVIKATVPCGGSVMRVKLADKGNDGLFPHAKMEVYAMGFRNQSGVAFGPKGTRFEGTLAVSDNGANDLGNRRIANSPEKLFLVTEKGQDAGFPDKDGFGFVTNKRSSLQMWTGSRIERPYPQLYLGEEPYLPKMPPYRFPIHGPGMRGAPLIASNPNPNGYINPVMEWDTNSAMDGIAWAPAAFGAGKETLFTAVFGPVDSGPESLAPTWPAIVQVDFLNPMGVKWKIFARNPEMGPNAYQKPENRGGLERTNDVVFSNDGKTMYVVDYGETYVDHTMPTPYYVTPKSGVIWAITYTGN
jgi:glucose/arabinose dehydrogenase